ncbi:MAG: glycosyltransferase [Streptococcaceae bacterium]|jgi:glycosyltransferase involved in cell wall biosynthesis|nr:glycosyltransferase [Streptococcaceae bacterium]
MSELISVIITNYNYATYIEKAIRSIFLQSYSPIELIVIDDGSSDDSLEIIERILKKAPHSMTTTLIARENKGIVATRNEGIQLSKGKYLLFLDADDYFDSDFVEKMYQKAVLTGADVIYPNWRLIESNGNISKREFSEFTIKALQLQEIHVSAESLIKKESLSGTNFRAEEIAEDWDFFNRLALSGKRFALAQDCYINYMIKADSRARKNSYVTDSFKFEALVATWRREFGEENVLKKNELLTERFAFFESEVHRLTDMVLEKDKFIRSFQDEIARLQGVETEKQSEIERLKTALEKAHKAAQLAEMEAQQARAEKEAISHSKAYKLGNFLASPMRLLRGVIKKR